MRSENITSGIFLPKRHNLNPFVRKHQTNSNSNLGAVKGIKVKKEKERLKNCSRLREMKWYEMHDPELVPGLGRGEAIKDIVSIIDKI